MQPMQPHKIFSSLRVSTLSHRLNVLRLSSIDWKPLLSDFLRVVFYSSIPDQFVSLTENDSQLSLVMDEKSVAAMQNAMYPQYTGKIWRAIQIYEGEDALNATGIVSSIAAPLARDGFSVLYISMYNSDLILVEEDQLSPALASIEQALQKLREKSPASLLPDVAKLVAVGSSPSSSTTITTTTSIRQPSSSLKNNSIEFSVVNSKLHLGWLRKTDVKHSCFPLMRLLLSPTQPDRFFSFTLAADEISIVISEEDYAVGEHHHGVEERDKQQSSIAFHQETWCAMEASVRNPKITPTQLVSSVSSTLADHGFSLFYVGSFSSDFTLVLHRDVDRAIEVLNEQLNS